MIEYEEWVEDVRYKKKKKRRKKVMAHDEKNEYKVGDIVYATECRPLSKQKRYFVAGRENRNYTSRSKKEFR